MRRRTFLGATGLLLLGGCGTLERIAGGGREKRLTGRLEELIPKRMEELRVPGASVSVVQNGRLAWTKVFGVQDSVSKTPVREDTLFEAASVSKTVFAYAVLKLCERGVLDLDMPLTHYTPKRFVEDERVDKVTARQVLCHSTGFADWRSSSSGLIQAEPGTRFQYSGEGYFYLQSVITQLTGKTDSTQCATYEGDFEVCATDFDDLMMRNLLRPLGMNLSGYVARPQWEGLVAHGHDPVGKPILKGSPRGSDVSRYGAVGGLHTNAREYAKFLSEVVAGKGSDAWRLTEKMKRKMIQPHIKLPKGGEIDGCSAWALGWGVQERDQGNLLVHSGRR